MATVTKHTDHCPDHHHLRHISWTAIFAGTLVAIGIGFLFSLFNVGIGLYSFTMDPQVMGNVAILGYIWLIITTIVTLFIAGWVAGRLGAFTHLKRRFGILYGFLAWSLALIVTLLLTSHINSLLPTKVNVVSTPPQVQEIIQTLNVQSPNKVVLNTEKVTSTAGKITLATFFLFLLGALASCLGGYVGMKHRPGEEHFIHHETARITTPPPTERPPTNVPPL